jgi:hypothetical protein
MFWDVVRDIACQKRRAKHIVWHQMCCVELFVCLFFNEMLPISGFGTLFGCPKYLIPADG